jgi:hypothetical protein
MLAPGTDAGVVNGVTKLQDNVIDAVEKFRKYNHVLLTTPNMTQDGKWRCSACSQRYATREDAQQCAEFEIATELKGQKVEHDCRYCGTSAVDCAPQSNGCCPECHEEDTHALDIDEWGALIHALPAYEPRDSDYLFGTVEVETDSELSAFDR